MRNETITIEQADKAISTALASGSCIDANELERVAVELCSLKSNKPARLKLLIDAIRFFYIAGMPERGLQIASRARKSAIELADASSSATILMLTGVCAADTGNLPLAMEAYADGLSLAQKNDDLVQEVKLWQNLGTALNYSGLFKEAIGCFARVAVLAKTSPSVAGFQSSALAMYK